MQSHNIDTCRTSNFRQGRKRQLRLSFSRRYIIDKNGKVQYNGNVSKEAHLDIVIGLPGSGKSSALVDVISQEFHSRIIDNDEAKKLIPEYNNGWGAGVVHEESQDISFMQLQKALQKKENIILPKVGSDPVKLGRIIDLAHKQGYKVNLHYVELDRERALGRMLTRFIEVGRFLDPKLIDKYVNPWDGNKIERCYEAIKEGGKVDGYSKWNNDVKWGEKPILIEAACSGEFIRNAGYGRRDGCSSVAGHDRQQGIMGRIQRKGNVETDWTDPEESGNGNEEKRQPSIIRKLDKYKEVAAKQSMHPQQHDGRKPQNNKESQREL